MSMTSTDQPSLTGAADWQSFDAPSLVGSSLRFVSGDPEGQRFRTHYFRKPDQSLVARIWFGPETEGPPEHAHGGSMAAVLDEVLGLAAWATGRAIVVANLNIDFRSLLPILQVVQVDTEVVSIEGRKVLIRGKLWDGKEKVYAEADCLCIEIQAI